jgi:hypothetical protein
MSRRASTIVGNSDLTARALQLVVHSACNLCLIFPPSRPDVARYLNPNGQEQFVVSLRHAIVFLDWDTARRITPNPQLPAQDMSRAVREIEQVFDALRRIVADHLTGIDWRLYHGWHSGTTTTPDYRAVQKFLAEAGTTVIDKVSFGNDITMATSLLSGGSRMPLYDTLRERTEKDGKRTTRQKMVDTGLVCDLLHSARSSRDDIHLIYGDDDDLLPGIFMAEAWGSCVHMYRPDAGSRHLNTRNIVTVLERV